MTANKDLNLTAHTSAHRIREHREDGFVDTTGKREKKWRGWYHVYVPQPDGTQKRVKRERVIAPCAGMTKKEARDEHRNWLRRLNAQPIADKATSKLSDLCDDLVRLREGDWEEHTRATNVSILKLIQAGIGHKAIEAITAEDLKLFINALPKRTRKTPTGKVKTGSSVSQLKQVITQLRSLFDLAAERELIRKNPARSTTIKLTVPKQGRKPDKSIFPPQELPLLLAQLNERDQTIVIVSMLGATRPNELFALFGRDIGPNWINVEKALSRKREQKETKTKRSRYIYLPAFIAAKIHAWIRTQKIGPNDLVFPNQAGRPIARDNFLKRRLRPAAKRAGISTLHVDFRMLRRSFATIAQIVGLDVKAIQAQLGHTRPDMSATEYMQPVDALRAEQMERMEGMIMGTIPMPVDVAAKLGSKLVN